MTISTATAGDIFTVFGRYAGFRRVGRGAVVVDHFCRRGREHTGRKEDTSYGPKLSLTGNSLSTGATFFA